MNPLLRLREHGQSYWLDNLSRQLIRSGELQRRVTETGLSGVTSNPTIFRQAICGSQDYDPQIRDCVLKRWTVPEIYRELVVSDVREACRVLRPVFDATEGRDGFVSLEVSPHLAHDSEGTVAEAKLLAAAVEQPNLFIKIPGTAAGVLAVEECLTAGLNINITLLFSINRYETIHDAYLRALEQRVREGQPLDRVASVASFFLSRIDTLVDEILSQRLGRDSAGDELVRALLGKAALANAKLAYQSLKRVLASDRWQRLAQQGARLQRLVWASTGTKNQAFSDVKYVEPLIGPYTINTMPEPTVAAFADHGHVSYTVEQDVEQAQQVMRELSRIGISFEQVSWQLEREGVQKFIEPFDALQTNLQVQRDCWLNQQDPRSLEEVAREP